MQNFPQLMSIKDPKIKIKDMIREKIAMYGENINVGKFARFQIGS